ncbi:MAG: helix-turn-helix transcriptional regulator, partial [Pseudomonadota bacterium]
KVLIRAKDFTLTKLANESGIGVSRLSQYLAKKSDLRGDSLTKVLKCLDIDLEALVTKKVSLQLGIAEEHTDWSDDMAYILENLSKLERKTILENVIARGKGLPEQRAKEAVERLKAQRQNWVSREKF